MSLLFRKETYKKYLGRIKKKINVESEILLLRKETYKEKYQGNPK